MWRSIILTSCHLLTEALHASVLTVLYIWTLSYSSSFYWQAAHSRKHFVHPLVENRLTICIIESKYRYWKLKKHSSRCIANVSWILPRSCDVFFTPLMCYYTFQLCPCIFLVGWICCRHRTLFWKQLIHNLLLTVVNWQCDRMAQVPQEGVCSCWPDSQHEEWVD